MLRVAWPEAFKTAVPSDVPPSKKSTLPVGVPAPGGVTDTVAVKVTDCPYTDGLVSELTVVVVLAFSVVNDVSVDQFDQPP